MNSFQPPDYWNFPPFFTIQPVSETRKKQLDLWHQLILKFHTHSNSFKMNPATFPLFENASIERKLSHQGQLQVINYLISTGNAEWEDESKTILNIFYKSPDTIGESIYAWAVKQGFIDNVFTVYELHSGEDHLDLGLVGMDPSLIRKALGALERKGKCAIIHGSTPDEDGVKFLSLS